MISKPTRRARVPSLIALALLAAFAPAAAQEGDLGDAGSARPVAPSGPPAARAAALEGSVSIDGRLDEEAWQRAPVITGFIQRDPVEGEPARYDTEVRVLFDEDALYVGARMRDPDPEAIARQLVRRDERGQFDFFQISVDPNRDRRTGYQFQVSAAGVQSDSYLFDDTQEDSAWDPVWESDVRVEEGGWVAELRIPLSQIRYEIADSAQAWGVNFTRRRVANNERSSFALVSELQQGRVSQFGRIGGIRTTEASRRLELRPYVLASAHTGPREVGDPFFDGREASARVGAELRYGLGANFALHATANPDFGQVEADPAVINLSAFETFFEERRPFFVEDAQVFDFILSGRQNRLFHSRRVGREPHGGSPEGAAFSDIPEATSILGAGKVTGRTSSGLSLGFLAAVTEGEEGRAFFSDGLRRETFLAEPRSEYGVFSAQQDFREGDSQIGGMFTVAHRDLPGNGSFDFLPSEAYSAGLKFDHTWSDREWGLEGFFAGSHVRGDTMAIRVIQESSTHFFQRPDASRVELDPARTSLTGAEWRLQLERRSGEHWTGGLWLGEVTPGFEINDLGFGRNREKLDAGARVSYREIEPGDLLRSYRLNFFTFHNWSHEALDDAFSIDSWGRAHTSGTFALSGDVELLNYWRFNTSLRWSPETVSRTATRGGPVMLDPRSVSGSLRMNTDRRKLLNAGINVDWSSGDRDSGSRVQTGVEVEFRPSPSLEIEVNPSFTWQTDNAQYVTTVDEAPFTPTFGSRYVFGDLERRQFSMESRVSWSFTPDLTLQVFLQPLLSAGDYRTYKQLAAPGTFDFDRFSEVGTFVESEAGVSCAGGRICFDPDSGEQHVDSDADGQVDFSFGDRDFNIRSLVGNAVLRWEYRPGSTIFLVWQQQRRQRADVGDFDFGRDTDALFAAEADNVFIIKANFWLGI